MWRCIAMLFPVVAAWSSPPGLGKAILPSVRAAFERHDAASKGFLTTLEMRRALSDIGVDVSRTSAHRLASMYGNATTVDAASLSDIVEMSAVASPARFFWLALDPDDKGPRLTRRAWNRFGKSGMLTPTRMAHYGIGLASLIVGTVDFASYVVHVGIPDMDPGVAVAHGTLHMMAAMLSLPRFQYKWDPQHPFHLWMPTSREANMWPAAIQYVWYTLAMGSDFVRAPADAWLSSTHPGFVALSWFVVATILYSTSRTILEKENLSGVYATHVSNVLQVAWGVAIPVMADVGKCLVVSHAPAVHEAYTSLVAAHPGYTQVYQGTLLGAMYIGNVVCALSSAEHHRAVTKAQIGDLSNALVTLGTLVAFAGIWRVDGGLLAWRMFHITLQGMQL